MTASPAAKARRRPQTKPPTGPRRARSRQHSRWRWALPLLVVLVWVVAAGVSAPFAGKLTEVQENDNSAFLPENAESSEVMEIQARFAPDADALPVILLWESDGGPVSPELRTAAEAALQRAEDVPGVEGAGTPLEASQDGAALQSILQLQPQGGGDALVVAVEELRAAVAGAPGGTVYVTGPGGIIGDFAESFGAIDGLLVLVALGVVLVILLVVYRSPLLPFVVILSAVLALLAASAVVYALAKAGTITLNGQSQGIMFILVVGAATDYALLLVSRFREELVRTASRVDAMKRSLRRAAEPIAASGGTVVLGVLCLLASSQSQTRGLGPVAALGVTFAVLAALTFLPAVLTLLGRTAYWPFRPVLGGEAETSRGVWGRVADLVGRRPRAVWASTLVVLVLAALFLPTLKTGGVSSTDIFLTEVESVAGQDALARHFPAGEGSPAVVVARADSAEAVAGAVGAVEGVAGVVPVLAGPTPDSPPAVVDDQVLLQALLTAPGDSPEGVETARHIRDALAGLPDSGALVGGQSAQTADLLDAGTRDLIVIIPLVLLVILVVLGLLLRAVVAPLLLVATVVLSFASTLGVAALLFNHVFDFPGGDPAIPLYAFVFLGALGVDYNIFLMTRVREEAQRGSTQRATLKGLAVTGGVITSAGIVLAATFGALLVLPILFLVQIAFIVAFGVLLDTFVVRALLVPALVHQLGPRTWWPSRLSRQPDPVGTGPADRPVY